MTGSDAFDGFPGITRGTVLPNLFFSAVLPRLQRPAELLAFLWVSRLVQEQRGEARFVTLDQLWADEGARMSFETMGASRTAAEAGLARCVELSALLAVQVTGRGEAELAYFVNNPASRRAVARARAGELHLRPETVVLPVPATERPGIFRLYEENIGTITPLIGDRLVAAAETYPHRWIEDAVREATERNRRNWRYIERILQNWAQEGRGDETPGRDSFEERKRRYLDGPFGTLPVRGK